MRYCGACGEPMDRHGKQSGFGGKRPCPVKQVGTRRDGAPIFRPDRTPVKLAEDTGLPPVGKNVGC